jgi:hypothetical protein
MTGTIRERFEDKFTKSDGCWEWEAAKNRLGYGHFRLDGKTQLAHRIAYQLYVGEIPEGMCVCHHCDNRKCVNPEHLFLGTQADNVRDCGNKGRRVYPFGENHYFSRLNEEQVLEIREKYSNGARIIDMSKEFGVAQGTIDHIVHRRHWTRI